LNGPAATVPVLRTDIVPFAMREAIGTRFGALAVSTGAGTGGFADSGPAAKSTAAAMIEALIGLLLIFPAFSE
jgi:hypothetical protein